MKKLILVMIILFAFCGSVPTASVSAIIFSDNYDSYTNGWTCASGVPSGYTGQSSCSYETVGGVTHYYGELATSGCRSGKCWQMWRHNGGFIDYGGYFDKDFTSGEFANHYKELYVRWYVKIDPNWDWVGGPDNHKLNRFYIGTYAGDHSGEWYFQVRKAEGATTFAGSRLSFYITSDPIGNYFTQKTISQLILNDGNWHSVEVRAKLNTTTGGSNGAADIWVDGERLNICMFGITDCQLGRSNIQGYSTNDYFTSTLPPGIGNLGSGASWNFPTSGWYPFTFDDYIVSTTYIGSPASPTGLDIEY